MDKLYICPDCSGDGKETCHNPDHGFYGMVSFHYDACNGGRGCPVCGWDEKHKVKSGNGCDTCNGTGKVDEEIGLQFLKEYEVYNELILAQ